MSEAKPVTAAREMVDAGELIDRGAWSTYQKFLMLLTALAVIFDGFDIQILGLAIPSLIREWHAARAQFGPVLAMGLAGMALGGPLAGYAGDRFGRRPALIGCVGLFGLATIATAFVHGFTALTILRLFTGIGTGGALPNASTLTAEFAPLARRPTAVKLTLVCVPLGGMLGGLLAARIIPTLGWRGLYAIGGILPLLFAVVLYALLPESPRFLARRPHLWNQVHQFLRLAGRPQTAGVAFEDRSDTARSAHGSVRLLFSGKLARDTAGLWIGFFSCLCGIYLVFGWLPEMLTTHGLSATAASSGLAAYNLGGVIGILIWTVLVTAFGSRRPMLSGAVACAVSGLILLATPIQRGIDPSTLILWVGINGLLANSFQTSLYALGSHIYPTSIRATGVAYAGTVGRIGGLLSSLFGGMIIQAGSQAYWGALALAMVAAAAGVSLVRNHVPGTARR